MITYDIYPEYQKCIQKLVWKWVKRSRFGFDELLSESNQAFLKAVDSYDSSKACFHTHLYITVNGRLRNYINQPESLEVQIPVTRAKKTKFDGDDYFERENLLISNQANPEQNCTFLNLIENLSSEAKEMVEVVLNTPAEMIELVRAMTSNRQGKMHVYKSNVRAYFKAKGWKTAMIVSCFDEIKSTFN